MKKPFAVHGLRNFASLIMLGGLLAGCSGFQRQPEYPPLTINLGDKTLARPDGQLARRCTAPVPGTKEAAPGECQGLRQVNVLEAKSITVLKTKKNPDCYIYVWDGTYFEICY